MASPDREATRCHTITTTIDDTGGAEPNDKVPNPPGRAQPGELTSVQRRALLDGDSGARHWPFGLGARSDLPPDRPAIARAGPPDVHIAACGVPAACAGPLRAPCGLLSGDSSWAVAVGVASCERPMGSATGEVSTEEGGCTGKDIGACGMYASWICVC